MPRMAAMEQAELTSPVFVEGNALTRARLVFWYGSELFNLLEAV